jgi:hypothetical protein
MYIRYFIDADSGLPHFYNHGVDELDVEFVVRHASEDRPGRNGSRIAVGQAPGGRYLRVIYVPDDDETGVFVVTAYPLIGKQLKAFRSRSRRRKNG